MAQMCTGLWEDTNIAHCVHRLLKGIGTLQKCVMVFYDIQIMHYFSERPEIVFNGAP